MTDGPTDARTLFGDVAPELADLTDTVLFGRVWRDDALSPRDRSLATISALVALYRHHELPVHLRLGRDNGLTREEVVALVTHLAFYSGWPTAMTALTAVREVFGEE